MRKILFWTHLSIGATAAIVIFIMSVTGVLLMYERQVIEWTDRHYSSTNTGDRLPPEALLESIASETGAAPDSLTLRADPRAPVEVALGTRIVYADAYSGRVLGESSARVRRFFRVVTDWHRWLALDGPSRPLGRSITGAANLIFLCLALSGMYLWLPRRWTWNNVRAILWFRGGMAGKARDFNWHNVIGIWSAVPLVAVILGALVISYPWATNLVYRVAGSEPPEPPRVAQKGADTRPGGSSVPGERRIQEDTFAGLDRAVEHAQAAVPNWQSIVWRRAGGNRISLAIAESHRGRVDLRSTLIVDRASGRVLTHEQFSDYNRGRQWRLWLRFIHTGEALGLAGQTIAGVVSAGSAVLVWTGLALAWRRYRAWSLRRRSRGAEKPVPAQV